MDLMRSVLNTASSWSASARAASDSEDRSMDASKGGEDMDTSPSPTSGRAAHIDPQGRIWPYGVSDQRAHGSRPFAEPPTQWVPNTRRQHEAATSHPAREAEVRSRYEGSQKSYRQLERENGDLQGSMQRMQREMQRMRAEMARLAEESGKYRAEVDMLRSREAEILNDVARQTFGMTANGTSTADVRGMMEDLDSEIFQTAAALSEFDFSGRSTDGATRRPKVDSELHDRVTEVLGGELMGVLSAKEGPILVQIALQTAMAAWCCTKIHSWVLDRKRSRTSNTSWAELYENILGSEDPKDAARWRAMTRKHLIGHTSSSDLAISLRRYIMDILTWTKSRYSGEAPSQKVVEAEFGDRILGVAGLVLKLNSDIGLHIVSEDLEAVVIKPGETFEAREMENMWPADERRFMDATDQLVVCSTGIGLRTRGENAMMVMKPKVLLRSTLPSL